MNRYQAQQILGVNSNSSPTEIKATYRKLVLELHPDKNKNQDRNEEFKNITAAYNLLKDTSQQQEDFDTRSSTNVKKRTQWGAPKDQKTPEQDWSKYTREFESEDPDFWREYEKKFWEEYNARIRSDGKNGEFDKAAEPKKQPNIFVNVDKSLCIGCCSCETIAPQVFEIDKTRNLNPKSSVINQRGAGFNKIMSAAETCPTKAIIVEDLESKERLFPY